VEADRFLADLAELALATKQVRLDRNPLAGLPTGDLNAYRFDHAGNFRSGDAR